MAVPLLNRFERARVLGARALQLSCGAPPLVEVGDISDPIKLAERELEMGVIPLAVLRN